MKFILGLCLIVFCLGIAAPRASALNPDEYPELGVFINEMVEKNQFSAAELNNWFKQAEIRPEIVEAMEKPKEALPWFEYKKIFVTNENVRNGTEFWKKNAQALARANDEFGVAPEIVIAILGVETQYGKHTGRFLIFDALTTLMLKYSARKEFFRSELKEYLLLARELEFSPLSIKGSYAGAIGIAQFMPSSYRAYAVDFDGDKKRDLNRKEDAIGSVANYFKRHGWKAGEPVTDEAKIDGLSYGEIENQGMEPKYDVKELRKYGITPVQTVDKNQLAALIVLQDQAGPLYRLTYNNFYVITRYNRSKNYAMAVYELSQLIRKQYDETVANNCL
jgi:membrane-bound lytic murein transglycosylase B